jgi:LPS export ABC transporter protein LptC
MPSDQRDRRYFPVVTLFIIVAAIVFASCKDEAKNMVSLEFDAETTPTMKTYYDTMHISDSGIMKYRVIAKTWEVFDRARDPHWHYPDGFSFEQFDSALQVVVTVQADTAWHFTLRKLWKFKGRVLARNEKDETFSSDELYWDSRQQRVYSDQYVVVNRPGQMTLRGTGFEANEQMTNYTFRNVGEIMSEKTILYVNEDAENREEREE